MAAEPIDDLLEQLGRGEGEAAEALFRAYTPYLRAVVRRQLGEHLRPTCDSADVVQSVWVQVVRRLRSEGWQVASEAQLRGLLATIARRRLVNRARKGGAARRAEVSADSAEWAEGPADRAPTPSQEVAADDLWEKMLDACPPEHRQVLRLRREGLLLNEIAERTGLHEGSVRRILRRVARELALAAGDDAE